MKKAGRAGAGQRRGNLAGDMTGLAHAGDHHPALAGQAGAAGSDEARIQARQQRLNGTCLDPERPARRGEQLLIAGGGVGGLLHGTVMLAQTAGDVADSRPARIACADLRARFAASTMNPEEIADADPCRPAWRRGPRRIRRQHPFRGAGRRPGL